MTNLLMCTAFRCTTTYPCVSRFHVDHQIEACCRRAKICFQFMNLFVSMNPYLYTYPSTFAESKTIRTCIFCENIIHTALKPNRINLTVQLFMCTYTRGLAYSIKLRV